MIEYPRRWAPGRLIGVLACALWAAVAPTPSHGEDWTTYQHDARHSGGSSSSIDPRNLSYSWSAPSFFRRGVIVGNRVFSTHVGEAAAFDLDTGEVEWNYTEDIGFVSGPSYIEGWLIYAAETSEGDQLIVHNAGTGEVIYRVDIMYIVALVGLTPTVARNPQTGALVAYLATHRHVEAVELGASEGTSLWTGGGSFGGSSFPTLAGESLILAGPGQYYAFDIHTGERNHFHKGNVSGGGGTAAAYDESRNHLYIMEAWDTTTTLLSAYEVIANDNIVLLWQEGGIGVRHDNAIAIDSEGYIYSSDSSNLVVRNPETGNVIDSVSGDFANGMAPMLSAGYIWTFSDSETNVYDRTSLEWVTSLPGSRGNFNTKWLSIGALSDTHFVMDNREYNTSFDVFAVTSACPWDFDGDGAVTAADLAMLLGSWGPCPDPCEPGDPDDTCPADLDGNCSVGPFDLALLLGNWGPCP